MKQFFSAFFIVLISFLVGAGSLFAFFQFYLYKNFYASPWSAIGISTGPTSFDECAKNGLVINDNQLGNLSLSSNLSNSEVRNELAKNASDAEVQLCVADITYSPWVRGNTVFVKKNPIANSNTDNNQTNSPSSNSSTSLPSTSTGSTTTPPITTGNTTGPTLPTPSSPGSTSSPASQPSPVQIKDTKVTLVDVVQGLALFGLGDCSYSNRSGCTDFFYYSVADLQRFNDYKVESTKFSADFSPKFTISGTYVSIKNNISGYPGLDRNQIETLSKR